MLRAQKINKIKKDIQELKCNNPKALWSLIKKLNKNKKVANTCTPNEWLSHFKSLHCNNNSQPLNNSFATEIQNKLQNATANKTYNTTMDSPITQAELKEAIAGLKNKKAKATDSVANEMLKCGQHILTKALLKLFNLVLESSLYPKSWAYGDITPILKSGDPQDPNNYRGITVSSTISKVFTTILNRRLTKYIENNNLLSEYQIGFRKGCRTSDHIFVLKHIIDSYKKRRKPIYACFVVFKKAFDRV